MYLPVHNYTSQGSSLSISGNSVNNTYISLCCCCCGGRGCEIYSKCLCWGLALDNPRQATQLLA